MDFWQNIYSHFDPVAVSLGSIDVHWYGIMYALALLSAIFVAKWLIKKDKLPISSDLFDSYIWWVEIGVILGARLGYIIFYDPNSMYYLTHPWQIFNPFINGEFTGISGMSYHGGLVGAIIGGWIYSRRYKLSFFSIADTVAYAAPLGYTFGRLGNFINGELWGRTTGLPWGMVFPGGGPVPRHPSQLYEAFLEGIVLFCLLMFLHFRRVATGIPFFAFLAGYGCFRFLIELVREPDAHLGYLWDMVTMGQLLSIPMIIVGILGIYLCWRRGARR